MSWEDVLKEKITFAGNACTFCGDTDDVITIRGIVSGDVDREAPVCKRCREIAADEFGWEFEVDDV